MKCCFTAVLSLFAATVFGQLQYPRISPATTLIQKIGLSEVRVDYSRPGARGRKVMGELVPYGRIWRVGANESTKVLFSDSVKVQGRDLAPGLYALYAIPQEKTWTIIFHRNTAHWGDGRANYNPDEDALRFVATVQPAPVAIENFEISFDKITHQSAMLQLAWENTLITFPIEFNTHARMMREIDLQVKTNPTAATFYEAARYFQEQEVHPLRAREYLQKAHALAGDKYYIHRVWALVEAQLGVYAEAIRHAEQSKKLAAAEGKDEFVRMNERSISEWRTKPN